MQSFLALTRVIAGFIQDDPSAIRAALRSAPAEKIYGQAVRHKCAAVLFETFVQHRLREPEFTALRGMLQKYAATFSLDAVTTRLQIGGVVRSLNAAGIEHILLKSAARLYAGEKLAERSQIFDLDVLVQREEADRAVRALSTEGYVYASPDWRAGTAGIITILLRWSLRVSLSRSNCTSHSARPAISRWRRAGRSWFATASRLTPPEIRQCG